MSEILSLVRRKRYFVLHAPRQTGKTSTLLALRDLLNDEDAGEYRCAYVNFEPAQTARENVGRAMEAITSQIAREARYTLGDDATAEAAETLDTTRRPADALGTLLEIWARAAPKPLVLLIDEIDALVGDSLESVLLQLRTGYVHRPEAFPQSVVLCGRRDVHLGKIETKSLRLRNFTRTDIMALLGQHTAATSQKFTPQAVRAVWEQTRGQPWLVNALAHEICSVGLPHQHHVPVSEHDIFDAREKLILRRETHLDQLIGKLHEPRVERVIEPLLSGGNGMYSDLDFEYARGLGLVASDPPLRIANPIYGEALSRALGSIEPRRHRAQHHPDHAGAGDRTV